MLIENSREVRLASHPHGLPTAENFRVTTVPLKAPSKGQVQVSSSSLRIDRFRVIALILCLSTSLSCAAQTKFNALPVPAEPESLNSSSDAGSSSLPDTPSAQARPSASNTTAPAGPTSFAFPTFKERRRDFLIDLVGPGGFIAPAFQALADQTFPLKVSYPPDGYPGPGAHPEHGLIPEWREGFNGYSKRYASRFGMGLIGTTTRYGVGELLHQDVSYHPCQCRGALPRAFHAISQTFVAHTPSGRSVPSLAALISPFVAAEIATVAWYPARYNASDALRTSVPLYIAMPIKNLMKERESQ